MARAVSIIEKEIRALSSADKAELLRVLLEELDAPPDEAAEAAWANEIQRRSREFEDGAVQCTPADAVFGRIEALIKK